MKLSNIKEANERVVRMILEDYSEREFIAPVDVTARTMDVNRCLEDTLYRILSEGGTDDEIYCALGAMHEGKVDKKTIETGNITPIDLGYLIPQQILTILV